jgi:hypothetical protein
LSLTWRIFEYRVRGDATSTRGKSIVFVDPDIFQERLMPQTGVVRISFIALVSLMLTVEVARAQRQWHSRNSQRHRGKPVVGVTVEAASPALIERVRTVVTDMQGHVAHIERRAERVISERQFADCGCWDGGSV